LTLFLDKYHMDIQQINAGDHLLLHCTNVIDAPNFSKIANSLAKIANPSRKNGEAVDYSTSNKFEYTVFHKVFSAIEKILHDHLNKEVSLTGFCWHKNSRNVGWHTHQKEFSTDPFNFSLPNRYVVVFYLHKEWDNVFGGSLKVGESENNPIQSFKCDPNSCVIHSASLSHGIEWLDVDFLNTNLNRIVIYSHWIEVERNDTSSN
jgi:hypothetical protein